MLLGSRENCENVRMGGGGKEEGGQGEDKNRGEEIVCFVSKYYGELFGYF